MSTPILPREDAERAPQTGLMMFPRMERPGRWSHTIVPLGDGWEATMRNVLHIRRIPDASDRRRASRKTKQGPLAAKACAPGVTPYLLAHGGRRGKRDALRHDRWTWLPFDLDAVPLRVEQLYEAVHAAFHEHKFVCWTTWSCKDGYASMRVFIPLAHEVTLDELIALWWWGRRRLCDAGLPADSAKAGEPANDSRALDARLFYLPAVPTPIVTGTEKWGGVVPAGHVSPDDVPVLDPDDVLEVGRAIRETDERLHMARWPSIPVPGAGATSRRRTSGPVRPRPSSPGNARSGATSETVDFSKIRMIGEVEGDLRTWADTHLPQPGTEVSIGSVFDETLWSDGDRATTYQTCRLHRDDHGALWAHDFRSGTTFFDTGGEGELDLDEDFLDQLLGDGEQGEGESIADDADVAEEPAPLLAPALPTLIVDSAEDAISLARERRGWLRAEGEQRAPTWSQAVRREWAQMGVTRRGTFHQGLGNKATGERRVHRRIPMSITHYIGGPLVVAGKIAATLRLRPHLTIGADDEEAVVVGRSLGERGGYRHLLPDKKAWNAFRARFNGALQKTISQIRGKEGDSSPRICEMDLPAYVVSHRPDGSHVVLCTDALPGRGQTKPDHIPPTSPVPEPEETLADLLKQIGRDEQPVEQAEPDALEQAVWHLIVDSFRFTPGPDGKLLVEGSVASSRTLPLDPRRVYRMANPVPWSVEEPRVDPEQARAHLHRTRKGYVEDTTAHTRRLSAQLQRAEAKADSLRRELDQAIHAAAPGLDPRDPSSRWVRAATVHVAETFGGLDLSLLREQVEAADALVSALLRALVSDTSLTTVELTDDEAAALWRDSRVTKERLESGEIDELLARLEVA